MRTILFVAAVASSLSYGESFGRFEGNTLLNAYPNGLPAKVSYAPDRPYYNATHRHYSDGIRSAQFDSTPDGMVKTGSTWGDVAGTLIETGIYEDADARAVRIEAERQAAKSPTLKRAENALIGLLIRAAILPRGAVSTAGLDREQVSNACLQAGMADLSVETGNLLSRIDGTLKIIEDLGGTPEDAVIHEDIN